jgi:prevent-host-death family protein
MQVNMLEAKNQLSKLVKAAARGEEVVIASNGKPVARLVPVDHPRKLGGWGKLRLDKGEIDTAFSEETEAEVAHAFIGSK